MAKLSRSLLVGIVALVAAGCGLLAQGPASGARINTTIAMSSGSSGPLDMVDARNGWAYSEGQIEHTTDGAQTFRIVTPRGAGQIDGLFFMDANRAWVVDASSTLDHTTNGGASWEAIAMHPALVGDPVFVDPEHGWLETSTSVDNHTAIDRTLWRTVDGGSDWQLVNESKYRIQIEPNVQRADCSPGSPAWTSATHGVAGVSCPDGSDPKVQLTDDGGFTWRTFPLPLLPNVAGIALGTGVGPIHVDTHGDLVTMVSRCIGPDGSGCRNYGELYRSSDGGLTWTAGTVVWGAGDVLVVDAQHAWLPDACATDQCSSPLLFTTSNGGVSWQSFPLPQPLWPNMHGIRLFSVASATEGFVVTSNEFEPGTRYYKTTDGGRTFTGFTPRVEG